MKVLQKFYVNRWNDKSEGENESEKKKTIESWEL